MAEHRAFRVLKQVRDLIVAANTAAGGNVELGRTSQRFEEESIDINLGALLPVTEFGTEDTARIDAVLRTAIDVHVRSVQTEEDVLAAVMALYAQVHQALLADPTLALSFVISCRWQGTDDFEPEAAGDRLGSLRTLWDIALRMDYADPTT